MAKVLGGWQAVLLKMAGCATSNLFGLRFSVVVIVVGLGAMWPSTATAETVTVKYRGPVDLAPFACEWITRSSVVQRLCYDLRERYIIVNLTGTYYHYCEVVPGRGEAVCMRRTPVRALAANRKM